MTSEVTSPVFDRTGWDQPAAWMLEERYPLAEIDGLGTPDEVSSRIAAVLAG